MWKPPTTGWVVIQTYPNSHSTKSLYTPSKLKAFDYFNTLWTHSESFESITIQYLGPEEDDNAG